jgi:hypothetical protein
MIQTTTKQQKTMQSKPIIQTFAAFALVGCLSLTAHAQIGSGWTQISPGATLQEVGGVSYSTNAGIETFSINNNDGTDEERVEQRIQDDYSSGTHQFEGYLKVTSLTGTKINLKQTFQANDGAWFLCNVNSSSGGTLTDYSTQVVLATNVVGQLLRLNTIHDMNTGNFYVYVNGVLKETRTGGTAPFYDKYGTYRAASGYGPVTAQWSNVRLWTGGNTNDPFLGTWELQNVTSSKVLNNGGSTTNGSAITQWTEESNPNLEFTFIPINQVTNGYYEIQSVTSGKAVTVAGSSTANDASLIQWTFGAGTGNPDQWMPVQISDSTWTFYNRHSGKVINNTGGSLTNGAPYTQYTWASSPNEEFNLIQQ